jgi:hypothetical protein
MIFHELRARRLGDECAAPKTSLVWPLRCSLLTCVDVGMTGLTGAGRHELLTLLRKFINF